MSAIDLPPLKAVEAFAAAVEHGGFAAAARRRGQTKNAVRRQVAALEDRLGGPLFDRDGTRLALTGGGMAYHAAVREALAVIGAAADRIRNRRERVFRVSTTPLFASHWLLERLADLERRNPGLHVLVDLDTSWTVAGAAAGAETCDAVIRFGSPPWPGLETALLFEHAATPVAAPAFFAGRRVTTPADLCRLTLLASQARPDNWLDWLEAAGAGRPRQEQLDLRFFANGDVALRAALEGRGVALLGTAFTAGYVSRGELVAPIPHVREVGLTWYLGWAEKRARHPDIDAVLDWLVRQAHLAGLR